LAGYRRIYNWAVAKLKAGFTGNLQSTCRNDPTIPEWVQSIPGHQKQEACDQAFDAYSLALANGGNVRFKSCRAKSQAIQFQAGNYCKMLSFERFMKVKYCTLLNNFVVLGSIIFLALSH